jgi:hypothetical protein
VKYHEIQNKILQGIPKKNQTRYYTIQDMDMGISKAIGVDIDMDM